MVLEYLLSLYQLWVCAYASVSLRFTFRKFLVLLRKSLNTFVLRLDKFLDAEQDSISEMNMSQPWSATTVLTSEMHPESVTDCLVQHGCKDITHQLNVQQCDQHVFTRGGFGAIYRGVLDDGQPIAIKCIESFNNHEDPEYGKNMKRAAREIYVWSHCSHQGVLPILGFARFRGQMALITPWRDAGSLKQCILRGSLRTPLRTCIKLAMATEYLHTNGIVHGDIKPDNTLMTDRGEPQLADFGSATLTHSKALNFTHTDSFNFTMRFAAPEVLGEESRAFTKESDIYALGMTMFNIMSGQLPFSDKSASSFINAVINTKEQPSRPDFSETLREDAAKDHMWILLQQCLNYAPEDRPKANEVKKALVEIMKLNTKSNVTVNGSD